LAFQGLLFGWQESPNLFAKVVEIGIADGSSSHDPMRPISERDPMRSPPWRVFSSSGWKSTKADSFGSAFRIGVILQRAFD
jgi:hypothetical protein